MKKVFFGFTYLILSVVILIYLSISRQVSGYEGTMSITSVTSFTGLPVIAIVLLIPTIVLNILVLIIDRKILTFCKDMVTFFASAFCLGTAIVGFFTYDAYYIPIVIAVCAIPMVVLSLIEIVKTLRSTDKEKTNEAL